MIERLKITNLRGIHQGEMKGIEPLTVLVGCNNSGKSTVLEAAYLYSCGGSASGIHQLGQRRAWLGLAGLDQVFFDQENQLILEVIDGEKKRLCVYKKEDYIDESMVVTQDKHQAIDERGARQFSARFHEANSVTAGSSTLILEDGNHFLRWTHPARSLPKPARLINVDSITEYPVLEEVYSDAFDAGADSYLRKLLAGIGMADHSLRILRSGTGSSARYVLHSVPPTGQPVAIYNMGDGFKRLSYIACALASASGLTLLEEPEAFQHPRYLRKLVDLIWAAIDQGTQIIMSTHSLDLLRMLFGDGERPLEESAIFRTQLSDNTLSAVKIRGDRAKERLGELGEDMRL